MPRKSTPQDFWRNVDRRNLAGCWPWLLAVDDHGYGRVRYHQHEWKAPRLAWTLTHGDPGDSSVLHHCDNPLCCNPSHLFLGTQSDNMRDSSQKGRHPRNANGYLPSGERHHARSRPEVMARGERNASAKLTADDVRSIRRARDAQLGTLRGLALKYGVTKGTINFIAKRKTWRHIPEEAGDDTARS